MVSCSDELRFWSQTAWVLILALPLVSTIIFGTLLHLCVPPCPRLLGGLNNWLFVKHLKQNLAHGEHYISYDAASIRKDPVMKNWPMDRSTNRQSRSSRLKAKHRILCTEYFSYSFHCLLLSSRMDCGPPATFYDHQNSELPSNSA